MKKNFLFIIFNLSLSAFSLSAQEHEIKKLYNESYRNIKNMLGNITQLNFEEAIFSVENAYYNGNLNYERYESELDFHTYRILQLAQANKDNLPNPVQFENSLLPLSTFGRAGEELLLNWAIFTYMTDTTYWKSENSYQIQYPMLYASSDPFAKEHWENTFISSLLDTNNREGNCFSLAALYYIFSQRLHSEAYLVTAPQHIYIQHKGLDENFYNIELGSRTFPGSGTIKTYTYTMHEAIVNGISMKRLNEKEAIALCLVQLAKGYERAATFQWGEGEAFMLQCVNTALQFDSLCLSAMLLKAEILENSNSKNATAELAIIYKKLHVLGYREMPLAMQKKLTDLDQDEFTHTKSETFYAFPFSTISKNETYYTLSENEFPEIPTTHIPEISSRQSPKLTTHNSQLTTFLDPVSFALSIDPLSYKFPSVSPYSAFDNNPINLIDLDGRAATTKEIQGADIRAIRDRIPEEYTTKDLISTFIKEMAKYNDSQIGIPDARVSGRALLDGLSDKNMDAKTRSNILKIESIVKDGNTYTFQMVNDGKMENKGDDGSFIIADGATFTIVSQSSAQIKMVTSKVYVKSGILPSMRVKSITIEVDKAIIDIGIKKEIPFKKDKK